MSDSSNSSATEPGVDRWTGLIEPIGKIVVGFIALSYGVGLLIENIHLNQFGVSSLSLVRLHYILAGLWFTGAILLVAVPTAMITALFVKGTFKAAYKKDRKKLLTGIAITCIIAFLPCAAFVVVADSQGVGFDWRWIALGLITAAFTWLVTLVRTAIGTWPDAPHDWRTEGGLILFWVQFVSVSGLVWTVLVLGPTIYGKLPAHLGGGQLQSVRLLLSVRRSEIAHMRSLGVPITAPTGEEPTNSAGNELKEQLKLDDSETVCVTDSLLLVTNTDDSYFVRADGQTLVFARSKVLVVIH